MIHALAICSGFLMVASLLSLLMRHRMRTVADDSPSSPHRLAPWRYRPASSADRGRTVWRGAVIVFVCCVIIGFGALLTVGTPYTDDAPETVAELLDTTQALDKTVAESGELRRQISNATFIGSSIKSTFHRPSCRYVRLIKLQYLRTFDSEPAAVAAGLERCQVCFAEGFENETPQ